MSDKTDFATEFLLAAIMGSLDDCSTVAKSATVEQLILLAARLKARMDECMDHGNEHGAVLLSHLVAVCIKAMADIIAEEQKEGC